MTQVVIRGESVYECDVCKRRARTPTNRFGLDVIQRCTITSGCQGKLHRVTALKDINSTPAFPPEVAGLQDWFARNILYTHQQPIKTAVWVVEHDLQNVPVLHTFVHRTVDGEEVLVEQDPIGVDTVDANTTRLTFASAESGQVQCLSPSTKNTTNYDNTLTVAPSTSGIQLSSNIGEITIATLDSSGMVDVTLTFLSSSSTNITYSGIDGVPSIYSPWVGGNAVIVNGKRYTIRSFNLTQTSPAPAYFSAGVVANGTAFYLSGINNAPIGANDVLFLMSTAPHTNVDRIYDRYVDAKSVSPTSPETFYEEGKGYVMSSVVKTTYPLILVV